MTEINFYNQFLQVKIKSWLSRRRKIAERKSEPKCRVEKIKINNWKKKFKNYLKTESKRSVDYSESLSVNEF